MIDDGCYDWLLRIMNNEYTRYSQLRSAKISSNTGDVLKSQRCQYCYYLLIFSLVPVLSIFLILNNSLISVLLLSSYNFTSPSTKHLRRS